MNDRFRLIVTLLLLFVVIGFIFRGRDYTGHTLKLDASILDAIGRAGIDEEDLLYKKQERYKSGRHTFLKIERHYKVGADFDEDSFLATIRKGLEKLKFNLEKSIFEKEGRNESFLVSLSLKNRILYEIKLLKKIYPRSVELESKGAKIAIVLDDFGYNMNNIDTLFEIDSPLTISILPNLPYSERIARQAGKHNLEVLLHLPLEPHGEELSLEQGTLMVDMPPSEVKKLLSKAIESVPGAEGVSNHMGSKATEDHNFMKALFKELKKRDLYFLDNLVTNKSICEEAGHEVGLRTTARNVFLDGVADEDYIEKQLLHTAHLATKTGWAIAVGHDRPYTIRVMARVIPQLKEQGFKFVHVSDLVR